MAYTTIDDPSAHFNTVLYTGNASSRSITGVGFQPDWTWIKARSETKDHRVFDSTRGATKVLYPSLINAEATTSTSLTSFDSDGFSIGASDGINKNTITYASWNWLANGGTTSSNSDGDITSTVQANTTAGFSIVTYTGNGNASAQTVGHGLGAECKVVIAKSRSIGDESWRVFHESVSQSGGGNLFLNGTSALDTSDPARITSTNTTTFTLDGYHSTYDALNENSATYLAYCFAEKKGYSKFGLYTGNGNADGAFVYTGFKPAFVIGKATTRVDVWWMHDNKRSPFNSMNDRLMPHASNAEGQEWDMEYLSNGFKLRTTDAQANGSGHTYIYMAFAEHPFVSNKGVPVTAR